MTLGTLASGRHPMTSPVTPTIAEHSTAVSRSARDRPTRTAGCHMGSPRNRSMTPVCRSVERPTAVPIADVVRFIATSPAIAYCV